MIDANREWQEQADKHVHEWEWHSVDGNYYCIRCPERMSVWESLPRLNATERLSAEDAKDIYAFILTRLPDQADALFAYADILEEE